MSESNGTTTSKPENRIKKANKVSSLDSYFAKARKRASKKSFSFKAVNEDATVTLTVATFPGFTAEAVCDAAESGVTVAGKLTQKLEGKAASFKEVGKGDEGYEIAEDFFAIPSDSE